MNTENLLYLFAIALGGGISLALLRSLLKVPFGRSLGIVAVVCVVFALLLLLGGVVR